MELTMLHFLQNLLPLLQQQIIVQLQKLVNEILTITITLLINQQLNYLLTIRCQIIVKFLR